jgi:excisionase family DNA binding protein
MAEQLYSVEQVAELLGLHVRTVRNYVRDGRLKAVRIGKQYRIAAADLEELLGRPVEPARSARSAAAVSSVVDVDDVDRAMADRLSTLVMAIAANPREEDAGLRIQAVYDEGRRRLKIIILGELGTTAELFSVIGSLLEEK